MAISDADRSIELDVSFVEGYILKAIALADRMMYDSSIEIIENALKRFKGDFVDKIHSLMFTLLN